MNLIKPEDILTEFFRAYVPEVERENLTNRQETDSESFDGDTSKKTFIINESSAVLAINSVIVGGITKNKYTEYAIDLDNKLITFVTAPGSGSDNVVISYEKGSNWVFPDKPRDDISKSKYPRMSVLTLVQGEVPLGVGTGSPYWMDGTYQIDVVAYKGQKCIINGEIKEGQDVADFIGRNIINQLTKGTLSRIGLKLYTPRILNDIPLPLDEEKNQFRRMIDVQFNAQDMGKQDTAAFLETFSTINNKGETTASWNTTLSRLEMDLSSNQQQAYNTKATSKTLNSGGQNFITVTVTADETIFGTDQVIYQVSTDNLTWQQATLGTELTLTTPGDLLYWRVIFIGNGANATYIENLTHTYTLS